MSAVLAVADPVFQRSLFAAGDVPSLDLERRVHRRWLDSASWIEHQSGFVRAADSLFDDLRVGLRWEHNRRLMYERVVDVPRLTVSVGPEEDESRPILGEIRNTLARRYCVQLPGTFAALYRDGNDSVAMHSDRVDLSKPEHVSGIVSLGGPRKFVLKPRAGGPSIRLMLESGDLLVLGGAIQHRFEHGVPKVAHAEPRIALLYFGRDRAALPKGRPPANPAVLKSE